MKKYAAIAVMAMAVCGAWATQMETHYRTIRAFETALSGKGEICCDRPGSWRFEVECSVDEGRDAVRVRLSSPEAALPPRFQVFFKVPGAGVQNVWTSGESPSADARHLWPKLWDGKEQVESFLARETPISVGFNSTGAAPVGFAVSEAFQPVESGLYADDTTCEIIARAEFFQHPILKLDAYEVTLLLDRRGKPLYETVRSLTDWISAKNGFAAAHVPEAAFDPLYSSWYAFLQDVTAADLEREAELAASLGMKTMILDDGWQKVDSVSFYSAVGDWKPVPSRFPDMKAHVAKVHAAGLRYMLWVGLPFIGDETEIWKKFESKCMKREKGNGPGRIGVLDPRFPEVREYLISVCERAVGEWGFDGMKLDFVNCFAPPRDDPAVKEDYAGRDISDVPTAVDRLMKDILARLRKLNPEVLIEFRHPYMGPAILQYGNMMRVSDCPVDPTANRRRMCDLRMTSGALAVHSDMLSWSNAETPEGAALPILNVLYSTVQYSMRLGTINPDHLPVIRHWIRFAEAHRAALMKGTFRAYHAENGFTAIEGESAAERIVTSYAENVCAKSGAADRAVYFVNATGVASMLVETEAEGEAELFDVRGESAGRAAVGKGLQRLPVPASGYARISWKK